MCSCFCSCSAIAITSKIIVIVHSYTNNTPHIAIDDATTVLRPPLILSIMATVAVGAGGSRSGGRERREKVGDGACHVRSAMEVPDIIAAELEDEVM